MSDPECLRCKGLGVLRLKDFVPLGYPAAEIIVPCNRCATAEHQAVLARRSGLELWEQEVRLDKWAIPELSAAYKEQRRQAKKVIKAAIEAEVGLYTFWGDYGAGKSLALKIAVNELRDRGAAGCYASLAGILEHLRSMYQRGEETSRYWQRLLEIPVLAVDEVTRFHDTGWSREKLFELVDTRYRKRKTHLTLYATNDNPNLSLPPSEALGYLLSRTLAPRCGAVQVCARASSSNCAATSARR